MSEQSADSVRCRSCRWWQRNEYVESEGEWGTCTFITDHASTGMDRRDVPHSARAYPADASSYSAWFQTRADFGCVEWRQNDGSGTPEAES